MNAHQHTSKVVGVDVGAPLQGFHAVAVCGGNVLGRYKTKEPLDIARWCLEVGADVVAVDAPCRWRMPDAPARAAERELAADRISCFSTPTEERAGHHAFYAWMLAGQQLYAALASHYPLYDGKSGTTRVSIETFPQAVACALAGEIVSARKKRDVRRALLQREGIPVEGLTSIDEIDAALCAVAARYFALGNFKAYGDATGGFIIVPAPATRLHPPSGETALNEILTRLPQLTPAQRDQIRSRLDELGA